MVGLVGAGVGGRVTDGATSSDLHEDRPPVSVTAFHVHSSSAVAIILIAVVASGLVVCKTEREQPAHKVEMAVLRESVGDNDEMGDMGGSRLRWPY